MRILTFASEKSGSGKSTLAAHVATQAMRDGVAVTLVDGDPAGTLSAWAEQRSATVPAVVAAAPAALPEVLDRLRQQRADLAVIDTAPGERGPLSPILAISDFAAVPARPSEDDLSSAPDIAGLMQDHAKPFVFVLNRGSADDDASTAMALMRLAQHGTLATAVIPECPAFETAMACGGTLGERTGAHAGEREVAGLWGYLSGRMDKVLGAARPPAAAAAAGPADRRKYPRKPINQPAILHLGSLAVRCSLLDISAGGAAVRSRIRPEVGDTLDIEVAHVGRLPAEVRNVAADRIGLAFKLQPGNRWKIVKQLTTLLDGGRTDDADQGIACDGTSTRRTARGEG